MQKNPLQVTSDLQRVFPYDHFVIWQVFLICKAFSWQLTSSATGLHCYMRMVLSILIPLILLLILIPESICTRENPLLFPTFYVISKTRSKNLFSGFALCTVSLLNFGKIFSTLLLFMAKMIVNHWKWSILMPSMSIWLYILIKNSMSEIS